MPRTSRVREINSLSKAPLERAILCHFPETAFFKCLFCFFLLSMRPIVILSVLSFLGLVTATAPLAADEYWQVEPPLNYSDVLYAGWEQITTEEEFLIYNGTEVGRTVRTGSFLWFDFYTQDGRDRKKDLRTDFISTLTIQRYMAHRIAL
jgi:hypothetical protein